MLHEAAVVKDRGADVVEERVWKSVERSVCFIDTQSKELGEGTGFIGQLKLPFGQTHTLLVTCHHVLPNPDAAKKSQIYFDRVDGEGHRINGEDLLDITEWSTCQSPDYTIIPVKSDKLGSIPDGAPVPLSLNKCEDVTLTQGDQLYVIHHPQLPTGILPQKYYRCHNGYQLKKIIGPVLTHEVTTYGGSSGAPIVKAVNGELVVVAVHAGTIPRDIPKVNVAYLLSDIMYHLRNKSLKRPLPSLDDVLKESTTKPQEESGEGLTIEDLQPYLVNLAAHILPMGAAFKVSDFADSVYYEAGKPQDKVHRILKYWLQMNPGATWEDFCKNLRRPGLDMHSLAYQIANKHCPHIL